MSEVFRLFPYLPFRLYFVRFNLVGHLMLQRPKSGYYQNCLHKSSGMKFKFFTCKNLNKCAEFGLELFWKQPEFDEIIDEIIPGSFFSCL